MFEYLYIILKISIFTKNILLKRNKFYFFKHSLQSKKCFQFSGI